MLNDLHYAFRLMRKSPRRPSSRCSRWRSAWVPIPRSSLKPLPYADANRLVLLGERWPTLSGPRIISRLNYRDWAEQNTVFERRAAATWGSVTVSSGNPPVHVEGSLVSPAYFDVFGLRATVYPETCGLSTVDLKRPRELERWWMDSQTGPCRRSPRRAREAGVRLRTAPVPDSSGR
jgi:hypothetical protein